MGPPESRGRTAAWIAVAVGLAVAIAVATVVGIQLSKQPPEGDVRLPPPLPPLTQLPAGRVMDWSRAGPQEGREPSPAGQRYNVREYGAVGDGTADDTEALQAAVAAANADPDGGVVLLPAGSYVLRQPLEIKQSGVIMRGDGEGATTIYIPVSLADVYPGTWSVDASGNVQTQWSFGGSFIKFAGRKWRSSDRDSRLAGVTKEVEQGAAVLPVDAPRRFRLGQWVRVYINDASTDGSGSVDNSERERAYSLQQRSAADEAAATSSGGGSSSSGEPGRPVRLAAAAPGSIAAWVYGEGLADSGDGPVLQKDEMAFTARVASIGKDWVALDRELPFPVRSGWRGEVHADDAALQGSGMEGLTIQFAHALTGPHLTERGFNAIEAAWATNLAFRNLTILNADNAIKLSRVDHSLLADITVGVTAQRWGPGDRSELHGHHAFSLTAGHANLLTRFNVSAPYHHDVSLADGALLNVISAGAGADLNLDLHRRAPWGNLFSHLHCGACSVPFRSGGREGRGAHSGRQNSFWNIGNPVWAAPPAPSPAPAPAPAASQPELDAAGSSSGRSSGGGGSGRRRRMLSSARQQRQQRRRLLQDGTEAGGSPLPVDLPPCDFGPLLAFVGASWVGDPCPGSDWLVQGLGADAPADLHIGQVAERRAAKAAAPPADPA